MFMCGCWFQHILTIQHPTITSGEIPKLIPFWADVSSQIPDKPIIWSCFFFAYTPPAISFMANLWASVAGRSLLGAQSFEI